MSISGISFTGLASGLDSASIIRKLVALERRPIGLLQDKKARFAKQKSLYGDLESKLDKLYDAAKAIRLTSTFLEFKAATDDEDKYLTASAGNGAVAGNYKIEIHDLAQARVAKSAGKADADTTTFGSGLLKFTVDGNEHFVNIPNDASSPSTLDNIAKAINDSAAPVSAQVLNTGETSNPYRLVITADNAGTKNNFTIGVDSADPTLTALAAEIEADTTVQAKNAHIKLDNIDVYRDTNTISDLITGVTLTLKGTNVGTPTTLTVSPDAEETSAKVKKFVDAYNEVVDFIVEQQKLETVDDTSSEDGPSTKVNPLFGDSALSRIRSDLRNIFGSSVSTGNTAYSLLSQVGIEADRDGKLTFNQSDFEEALSADEQAVKNLFADGTNGIAKRIYDTIDGMTDSIDGVITTRTSGIERTMKDIDRQISRAEERVERYEELLTRRFSNLEVVMGRLNSQMGALASLGIQS